MQTFGDIVKTRRIDAGGMSVRTFAPKLGISYATLSRIERGQEPDIRSFFKICKALMLAPDAFSQQFTERDTSGQQS